MDFRGAWAALFGRKPAPSQTTTWRGVGNYHASFAPYNSDLYANEVVRACIRTLAKNTAKARPRCVNDPRLERLLEYRPNLYMSGADFLSKVRTMLELNNTVFIYLNRDDAGRVISLYPVTSCSAEAVESGGRLYIKFAFTGGGKLVAAWADLAVLRKDYNTSDIFGDANTAITGSLELLDTTAQGMANAIKSTANLKGLLKFTKGMLKGDDIKASKTAFVTEYLNIENTSGIAALDSTMEYTPLKVEPHIADYEHIKELRDNILRYFGVSEEAILGKLVGDQWAAFYSSGIEPFLIALGLELTYKVYTDRERGFGNAVLFQSDRLQYMTMAEKLNLAQLVDRKTMLPNELRAILNLPPVPWGDEPLFWQDPKGKPDGNDIKPDDKGPGKEGDDDKQRPAVPGV